MSVSQLDNLKPGDYFTINRWLSHQDNSWVGYILKVLTVDSPFIVFETQSYPTRATLDVRKVELQRLSDEFVAATLGEKKSVANDVSDENTKLRQQLAEDEATRRSLEARIRQWKSLPQATHQDFHRCADELIALLAASDTKRKRIYEEKPSKTDCSSTSKW